MKNRFIKNFITLNAVYLVLLACNFYLFPALNYSLGLSLTISFLVGAALCYTGSDYIAGSIRLVLNKFFNAACLSLIMSLSLLIVYQNHLELQRPIVNANTVNNLPEGNYLLKVGNVSLNTKIIGHAFRYQRQRGVYNRFKHYYAIPIITNKDSLYSNWLVIYQDQRINKILNKEKIRNQFQFHTSYYFDSLSHFNTKNIKFYSVSDYRMAEDKNHIMYRSVFNTHKTTNRIKTFQPHYTEIATYRRERNNIVYGTIAITAIVLAAISWIKAVLQTKRQLKTSHLN